ncbi:recombinase family protein [Sphingomonas sp. ID0503]|uniref:recombinase family protein n=1 Tax=Sphingomonas sp. ID0503 TaxID=3399691 RepID=UPI003AFB788F
MAKAPKPLTRDTRQVRCAIYTRKSTEEGLEQEFNSLDAQREACAAYIVSQRHEGWVLVSGHYDDGGFSGGNMERPGLKRLMAEVEASRVDVIVVYKVDRLTRSLADFAKIVEVLDAKGASFVSITQAFNTTTSMGRLTLNVLLSFAQFEREVTGERIRDKIAASKRKGMWMGGPVPLGYEVQDRRLVVHETEAELVRHIYDRYVQLPSVNALIEELTRDGHKTKIQVRTSGPHRGGQPFRRGTLYHLLSNRIYRGFIVHRGEAHAGEHPSIVSGTLWDAVQQKLAERGPGGGFERTPRQSHLIGLLYDGEGRAMTPSHASRGPKRYRYYMTREADEQRPRWRVSAHDLEQVVANRIRMLLRDRNQITRIIATAAPASASAGAAVAARLADDLKLEQLPDIGVEKVTLYEEQIEIRIPDVRLIETLIGGNWSERINTITTLSAQVERVRRGHELRLVLAGANDNVTPAAAPDERMIALLAEAFAIRDLVIAKPELSIAALAFSAGACRKRYARLLQISWLAPDIIRMIADGAQPSSLTAARLMSAPISANWAEQRTALLP